MQENEKKETIMKIGLTKWFVEETKLTVAQISDFCGISPYDVRRIKNKKYKPDPKPISPIGSFVLESDVKMCEQDPTKKLEKQDVLLGINVKRPKSKVFTSSLQKQERNNCVLWFVNNHPEVSNSRIAKLTKTTVGTVEKIRSKTHQDYNSFVPKKPSNFNLCTLADIENAVLAASKRKKQTKAEKLPSA